MAAFEDESWQNRQRLIHRIQQEMREVIEKKLAGLHRLDNNNDSRQDALQGEIPINGYISKKNVKSLK